MPVAGLSARAIAGAAVNPFLPFFYPLLPFDHDRFPEIAARIRLSSDDITRL
jgi:hypothetical protein